MANQKLVILNGAVNLNNRLLDVNAPQLNQLLADGWRIVESSITSHRVVGDKAQVSTLLRLER